jgi:hypothetical protein
MRVDLHKRDTSRNRLLLTGQAIVPIAYNPQGCAVAPVQHCLVRDSALECW